MVRSAELLRASPLSPGRLLAQCTVELGEFPTNLWGQQPCSGLRAGSCFSVSCVLSLLARAELLAPNSKHQSVL